jgi:hypothetical protein
MPVISGFGVLADFRGSTSMIKLNVASLQASGE